MGDVLKKVPLVLMLAGTLGYAVMVGCSSDSDAVCDSNLCAENSALKTSCQEAVDRCRNIDSGSQEECDAIGLGICGGA